MLLPAGSLDGELRSVASPFALMLDSTLCKTETAMWLQVWEKVRGYDKWIEAEATVQTPAPRRSPDWEDVDERGWLGDILVWTDGGGNRQSADFIVPDDCTLYQKVSGDTLVIRYDPRNPGRFYLRQLHLIRIRTTVKRILIAASILGLVVMALWVREKP